MAVTKKKIGDAVIKLLNYNTDDARVKPQFVHFWIERARNSIAGKLLNQDPSLISGEWITTDGPLTVQKDTSRNLYYVELTKTIITLPYSAGLRFLHPPHNPAGGIAIVQPGSDQVRHKLEVYRMGGLFAAWLEGKRIYFRRMNPFTTSFIAGIIQSIEDLDENDPIGIPAIMEEELIQSVVRLLREQKETPEDKVNDARDDSRTA